MCLKCMISWLWVRDIILGNLGGPGSIRWKLLKVELRFPWIRNSASGQQLQLMIESPKSSLPVGLLCGIQTCLASPHNCISQFLAINLKIYFTFVLFLWNLTDTDFLSGKCCYNKWLNKWKWLCKWVMSGGWKIFGKHDRKIIGLDRLLIEVRMLKILPGRAQEEVRNIGEKVCIILENLYVIIKRMLVG